MPSEALDPELLAEDAQRALNQSAELVYREMAGDYDRHLLDDCNYASPETAARQVAEHTAGTIRVLDAGAGTGLAGQALVNAGVDARIVGVDIVGTMLDQIRCPAYTQCVVADATRHLPIRPGSFDAAIATGLMEHVLEPWKFLGELFGAVKPRGCAVFTFVPNQRGRTEIFDRNAGFLSHDPGQIAAAVQRFSAEIVDRTRFNAYRNGNDWIQHEAVTVVCR